MIKIFSKRPRSFLPYNPDKCDICRKYLSDAKRCTENLICCDCCTHWSHYDCAELTSSEVEEIDKWYCKRCIHFFPDLAPTFKKGKCLIFNFKMVAFLLNLCFLDRRSEVSEDSIPCTSAAEPAAASDRRRSFDIANFRSKSVIYFVILRTI